MSRDGQHDSARFVSSHPSPMASAMSEVLRCWAAMEGCLERAAAGAPPDDPSVSMLFESWASRLFVDLLFPAWLTDEGQFSCAMLLVPGRWSEHPGSWSEPGGLMESEIDRYMAYACILGRLTGTVPLDASDLRVQAREVPMLDVLVADGRNWPAKLAGCSAAVRARAAAAVLPAVRKARPALASSVREVLVAMGPRSENKVGRIAQWPSEVASARRRLHHAVRSYVARFDGVSRQQLDAAREEASHVSGLLDVCVGSVRAEECVYAVEKCRMLQHAVKVPPVGARLGRMLQSDVRCLSAADAVCMQQDAADLARRTDRWAQDAVQDWGRLESLVRCLWL